MAIWKEISKDELLEAIYEIVYNTNEPTFTLKINTESITFPAVPEAYQFLDSNLTDVSIIQRKEEAPGMILYRVYRAYPITFSEAHDWYVNSMRLINDERVFIALHEALLRRGEMVLPVYDLIAMMDIEVEKSIH